MAVFSWYIVVLPRMWTVEQKNLCSGEDVLTEHNMVLKKEKAAYIGKLQYISQHIKVLKRFCEFILWKYNEMYQNNIYIYIYVYVCVCVWAGIATGYWLDGPGIESLVARFFAPFQTGPGAHPPSNTVGTGSLSRGKAAGAWSRSPTPSCAEVKERVELYLCSHSGSS
jgi:hypothetical protein